MCMYVSEIFCVFSFVTKQTWKVGEKWPIFQMHTILKFDFQKKKTITYFRKKLSKLHKIDTILHVAITFFS